MLSSLFAQFRHQYPNGSLTTELLMPHADQYLVKATVTIGEQIVATALAAESSLTMADDHAKSRVLALLGFGQETPQATTDLPNPQASAEPGIAKATASPPAKITAVSDPAPAAQPPTLALTSPAMDAAMDESNGAIDESEDIGRPIDSIAPDEAPAPSEVPASSLAAAAIENFDDTNPVDLSDIIAQTDVEMTRLGWSSIQGRNYLEQTFNKRSRQQLTDEEILTFLLYLEEQPTPQMG